MKKICFTLLVFCAFVRMSAQQNESGSIASTDFAVTRPLREIFAENPVDENNLYEEKESSDRQHREATKFEFSPADGPQYGNDPKHTQTEMGDVKGGQTKASWLGQSGPAGFRPVDPSGAAGPNHYVQMINSTTFRIYNKTTGTAILTGTLGNLWTPATGNSGDPIVMYDKAADRWFLAQFGSSTDNKIYIAVSTSSDPTGSYYTYTYTSPQFPDYLKFCVWVDGYYMTSNQSTQKVFAFERTAMLAGTPTARAVYTNYSPPKSGFFVPLPGDAGDGTLPPVGTPCPIFSYSDNGWGAGFFDRVNIYNMAVNWVPATPTATITLAANIATAAFDASYNAQWNDVSQPGTNQKLDGIGGVCMYRAQWKSWSGYNTIVLNWAVKISNSKRAIKWCELRQNQSTGVWSMYQEGIYDPDTSTRWMGSIAMDNNGSIGLSYLKANTTGTIYPGLYYTGRRSCDPLGTLPITEVTVIAGTGYQTGTNRNGDYAHTCLDPDGVTFWSTSEYMGGTSGSSAARTRIFSYQIAPCSNVAGVAIALTSGTNPTCTGSSLTFTATPTNGGSAPAYQWKVNGTNVGTNSNTYTTTSSANGDVVTCVMTSNLAGVTGNPATSNAITITINSATTPSVSIAITSGSNPSASGASVTFTATPTNGGTPSYQWKVNGTNVGTNSATYTTTTLTNGAIVSCVMTSSLACASPTTATSNSITMTITTSLTYCAASTTSTSFEHISNFTMGVINNTSTATSYSNFSAQSTNVVVGTATSFTVTIGGAYSTDQVFIWCDWNRNGVFTDAGEAMYTSTIGIGPMTGSINPPAGTTTGPVRMRIRLTDTGSGPNTTPCGASSYGEVEDYTLNVSTTFSAAETNSNNSSTPVTSLQLPIDNTDMLEIYPNPNNGSFTIKANGAGTYYLMNEAGQLIQTIRLNEANNNSINISGLSNGFYIITGKNANGISKQKVVVMN